MTLINKEELMDRVYDRSMAIAKANEGYNCAAEIAEVIIKSILEAPDEEAEPVIHAKWIKHYGYEDRYYCSVCQDIWRSGRIKDMKYCPSCGAKMDGADHE